MEIILVYYCQVIFLSFIVINHLTEIYLSRRQLQTLERGIEKVPVEFESVLSLADHQKAIHYGCSRLRFSQLHLVWDAVLLFYWFPFRGLEKLYLAVPGNNMHKEVIFLVSLALIQMLLNLPWTLYSTFVLEEKFGFNRTTSKIFLIDRVKGLALGGVIGIPLLYAVIAFYEGFPKTWWIFSFLLLTFFQFAMVLIYPKWIAPLFNKFRPLEGEELKTGIEKLVSDAGFVAKEVYVMDASKRSSHGNAYFTGFGKTKRIVFFDTLLSTLSPKEVFAILAHELGHLKLKHIPKSLATGVILSFIGFALMGYLAQKPDFYAGHFVKIISPGALLILFSMAVPLYTFWFTPLSSWISRRREFEADAYAAGETGPDGLIAGLLKLYKENASPVITDRIYSAFYHSHPPALERVKRLKSFEGKSGQ
jgi:STE24 endopeptidase